MCFFDRVQDIGIFEHSPVTVTVCTYPEMDIFVKQRFGDFAEIFNHAFILNQRNDVGQDYAEFCIFELIGFHQIVEPFALFYNHGISVKNRSDVSIQIAFDRIAAAEDDKESVAVFERVIRFLTFGDKIFVPHGSCQTVKFVIAADVNPGFKLCLFAETVKEIGKKVFFNIVEIAGQITVNNNEV